jgi:Tfp pilus assembly protein PilV
MKRSIKGVTLVELMIAATLFTLLMLTVTKVFTSTMQYFRSTRVRQQLQADADRSMTTVLHDLQHAKASTVVICSCGAVSCVNGATCTPPTGTPPNSRIEFIPAGSTSLTAIYWNNAVVLKQTATNAPEPLADHVTGLLFTGDGQDLSRLWVSLRLDMPSSPQQMETVLLTNQAVRLTL